MRHVTLSCFGFLVIATASSGCGWLARVDSVRMKAATNSNYRTMPASTEVLVAPLLDCSSNRRDIAPAKRLRAWLSRKFFPVVWQRLGVAYKPVAVHARESSTCKYLFDSEERLVPNDNEQLRRIASKILAGQREENVFLILYATFFTCEEVQSSVRDADGVLIGSVGTGEERCFESTKFHVAGYMFNRKGDLIYSSGGLVTYADYWEPEDVQRVSRKLLDKLPRVTFVARDRGTRSRSEEDQESARN